MTRRKFLGAATGIALGGAGAGAYLLSRPEHRPETRKHYRAIVIGSGYGGGVSALRLGQAGVETLVLERGRLWDTPDADGKRFTKMLPADHRAGWFADVPPSIVTSFRGVSIDAVAAQNPGAQPKQAGICEKDTHGAHNVFRGVGVGGGSMVNAAIAAVPTADQVRAAFPDIDPAEFLGTYVERAKTALRISYRNMDWFEQTPYFQYARVGRMYAETAGYKVDYNGSAYSFDYMVREANGEVPLSALDWECQFGNNYGRDGSVDVTYIAEAVKTGKVTLQPLTEVTGIRREQSGEYVVSTRRIDRWGAEQSRDEFGCDQLHLAAGVLGTNQLLLRARETGALADLSDEIGRGYGNNGDVMVAHNTKDTDPVGTKQSLLGMINLDGRDDPENPVYASMFSLPLPVETNALGYYVMVKTGDRSDITFDKASDSITIDWPQSHTDHLIERAKIVFDKLTQANGVDYRDDLFSGQVFAPNTVHPLGGCVRGKATDAFGRVNGYDNRLFTDEGVEVVGASLPG
ncbi:MAG: GMC family oxidoreductase [Mycolicibacterium cosmeticum]|nr:GMC family oxidoreductase [Mycolicibacterium cosmeticum]